MKENILQTLNNLNVIKDNLQNISPIEKDIILQELRNLYVTVLETETVLEKEEPNAPIFAPINTPEEAQTTPKEENTPEIEEVQPETKDEIPNTESTEEISPELLDLFEEEAEEAPMLIMPEINEHHVEGSVNEMPEIGPEKQPIVETKEKENEPTIEQPTNEQTDNEPELFAEEPASIEELFVEEEKVEEPTQQETISLSDDLLQFLPQESTTEEPVTEIEILEKTEEVEKPNEKITAEEEVKPETIETAQPERRSLNDLLQSQHEEKSLSEKMRQSKIEDLLKAISLNDKFLFIRELFDGKGEDFSNCIQKLNHCANIDEAFESLEMMKKHYFWESTSAAYLSLCDLIRRRYIN